MVRSQYMNRSMGHLPREWFCSAWSDKRGDQNASMAEASSGFQLCTNTSTVPAACHGWTTWREMLSAQCLQRFSSPGMPFFSEAVRV